MSDTYNLFQQGRAHLARGMNAQATVALEKAKRREPEKASIREALGIAYFRIHRFAEAEREFREIRAGLCVLVGIAVGDDRGTAVRLAEKTARLRVFENEAGKFDRSLLDVGS